MQLSKTRRVVLLASTLIAAVPALAQSGAATGGINVELNKLEPVDSACRAYLVTQNLSDQTFNSLKLDVVMFDAQGIVAKRLAVQIAPMPAGKTSLKVFDIADLACDKIGQLLLNNVLECTVAPAAAVDDDTAASQATRQSADQVADQAATSRSDCLSLISVSQRGNVPFIQ